MKEIDIVKAYYDNNSQKEWERLDGFSFEFEITRAMFSKYLMPGSVLDIGGGPGRYSLYLASLGYEVTMVELSEANINLAKKKAQEQGLDIRFIQGDARDLSLIKDETFDNVLVMGPLYHLFELSDRELVVNEAKKHLKKDGRLFASFIVLSGGINYYLSECPEEIINETELDYFDRIEEQKTWSGKAFTMATIVDADEIVPFFDGLELKKVSMFGQEGITGPRQKDLEASSEEVRDYYLKLSLRFCEIPKYFAYTNHVMYIGELKK